MRHELLELHYVEQLTAVGIELAELGPQVLELRDTTNSQHNNSNRQ